MMKAKLPKVALVLLATASAAFAVGANGRRANAAADEQPAVVEAVAPNYPPVIMAAGMTVKGKLIAVVNVKIDNAGAVTFAQAPDAHPFLVPSCVRAAKQWRFDAVGGPQRVRTANLTFIVDRRRDEPESQADRNDLVIFRPPYTVEVRKFAPVIKGIHSKD